MRSRLSFRAARNLVADLLTYSPIAGLKITNSHVGVGLRLSVPFTVFPRTFADRPGQDHPG